jgi:hypothetical protein
MKIAEKKTCECGAEFGFLRDGRIWNLWWEELETQEKEDTVKWDLFICHASEDKAEIVRPLADALVKLGYRVWYDDFELRIGDSLRRSIDKGLIGSRYGLVVLSPSFFNKDFPQTELDGLAAREREGKKVILPVWHHVDEQYVKKYSPTLADKFASKTLKGLDVVVQDIQKVLGPAKQKPDVEYIEELQAYLFFPEGTTGENITLAYHAKNLRYRLIVNLKTKPPKAYYLTPNSEGWKFIEKYPHRWVSIISPIELNDSFTKKWCDEKGFELKPWVAEKKDLTETS